MQVFVITTSTGIWSVTDSMELAKEEAKEARRSEYDVQIRECGVITARERSQS